MKTYGNVFKLHAEKIHTNLCLCEKNKNYSCENKSPQVK